MIIISQDKTRLINFDNVKMIYARGKKILSFDNTYNLEDDGDLIGTYETEKRAKEVLQEIKSIYEATELLKMPTLVPNKVVSGEELVKMFSYEMPEE